MALAAVWDAVGAAGITLSAEGEGIRAEPKGALTDPLRALIRSHRTEILAHLRGTPANSLPADLRALIERVAAHYRTPPDELQTMIEVALGDVASARECFTATALLDGIA